MARLRSARERGTRGCRDRAIGCFPSARVYLFFFFLSFLLFSSSPRRIVPRCPTMLSFPLRTRRETRPWKCKTSVRLRGEHLVSVTSVARDLTTLPQRACACARAIASENSLPVPNPTVLSSRSRMMECRVGRSKSARREKERGLGPPLVIARDVGAYSSRYRDVKYGTKPRAIATPFVREQLD